MRRPHGPCTRFSTSRSSTLVLIRPIYSSFMASSFVASSFVTSDASVIFTKTTCRQQLQLKGDLLELYQTGPQQFGPVAVVFELGFARAAAVLSPCDTGGWEDSCGHDWWQFQCARHATETECKAAHDDICVWTADSRCAGAAAGAVNGKEFNCSAGSTLGRPSHMRHLLPAAARLWNPWSQSQQHSRTRYSTSASEAASASTRSTARTTAAAAAVAAAGGSGGWTESSVDTNMAMMIARLLSPWNATVEAYDHMDFYIEAAILGASSSTYLVIDLSLCSERQNVLCCCRRCCCRCRCCCCCCCC